MEYYRDDCCEYYEKDRIVYDEPHQRHQHHHQHHNHGGDSFRFREERRFDEEKHRHGGLLGGGESDSYKVEEAGYMYEDARMDGHRRNHHGRNFI